MGIIAFIILGLLAGAVAKALMPGDDPGGWIVTALIGVAGALWAASSPARCSARTRWTSSSISRRGSRQSSVRSSCSSSTASSWIAAAPGLCTPRYSRVDIRVRGPRAVPVGPFVRRSSMRLPAGFDIGPAVACELRSLRDCSSHARDGPGRPMHRPHRVPVEGARCGVPCAAKTQVIYWRRS